MYDTTAIANYFIEKGIQTGEDISPMKLIKLVYIAHGWHLGNFGEPLISEAVEAWKYGPVIDSLYHTFKKYGNRSISRQQSVFQNNEIFVPLPPEQIRGFLDDVWDKYAKKSAIALSKLTHDRGTPWDEVWNKREGFRGRNVHIPNEVIERHYAERVDAEAERRYEENPRNEEMTS